MESKKLIDHWDGTKHKSVKEFKKLTKRLITNNGRTIDALAHETHAEVFNDINCLDCANCCTSIPPMLVKSDVKRISKHLGLRERDFESDYLRTDDDGDLVMKNSPCVFLGVDNKCDIYDVRPKACRQYPHTDDYSFKKNAKLHGQNAMYCPAVFHILNRLSKIC